VIWFVYSVKMHSDCPYLGWITLEAEYGAELRQFVRGGGFALGRARPAAGAGAPPVIPLPDGPDEDPPV
jgi:hypothetical protein